MKKITIGMFSLAALVAMATISAKAIRAEDTSLEGAKQESGVGFGEMGGLNARGSSSAVRASDDGVSRPALTVGKLAMKVMQGGPEVPSPAPAFNEGKLLHSPAGGVGELLKRRLEQSLGRGGLLALSLEAVGATAGIIATGALAISGGVGLALIGVMGIFGALAGIENAPRGKNIKEVVKTAGQGFLSGVMTLADLGAVGGYAIARGIEIGAHKVASLFKKGGK